MMADPNILATDGIFYIFAISFLTLNPLASIFSKWKDYYDMYRKKLVKNISVKYQQYRSNLLTALIVVLINTISPFTGFDITPDKYLQASSLFHAFFIGSLLALALHLHNSISSYNMLNSMIVFLTMVVIFNIILSGIGYSEQTPRDSTPVLAAKLMGFQLTIQQLKKHNNHGEV